MSKSKEELLEELAQLGYSSNGRKKRSDIGKPRNVTKPRSDRGKPRIRYNTSSAAFHKKVFNTFITSHSNSEYGDDLIRDQNMLFLPSTTKFYKSVTAKGYSYRVSTKRRNHPEELRWNWFIAEYEEAQDENRNTWGKRINNWYFIHLEDIELWTYSEWAWAYTHEIAGHPNRQIDTPIILSYDKYLNGEYTFPEYDEEGEVIWTKRK